MANEALTRFAFLSIGKNGSLKEQSLFANLGIKRAV